MRAPDLKAFRRSDYLDEIGDERVIAVVQPALERLIDALADLPENADAESKRKCFEACVLALNEHQLDIDTITREVLCDRLYDLGEMVGLDASNAYLDEWRDF